MKGYPGNKATGALAKRIVSLMPRHRLYVEPFLGGGGVLDLKLPAARTVASDLDAEVIGYHRAHPLPGVEYHVADAFDLLTTLPLSADSLVYLDPPYHPTTRSLKRLYRYVLSDAEHRRLLELALELPCAVMLSGYLCAPYDDALAGWHREDIPAMTHGGLRTESVWCNFRPGQSFHDTRWLGRDYRERERIRRKRKRWADRLRAMAPMDRAVILEALDAIDNPTGRGYGLLASHPAMEASPAALAAAGGEPSRAPA